MKIHIAKTIGYCFGVDRAVNAVNDLLSKNRKVCTLGPIIHNPKIIKEFEDKGVKIIDHPYQVPNGYILVIRAHGTTKENLEYMEQNNIDFIDATCPFVKKIHRIVEKNSDKKDFLLISGNSNHPEVIGIKSFFYKNVFVFDDVKSLNKILDDNPEIANKSGIVVSQTTFSKEKWIKYIKLFKKQLKKLEIFDTICKTTYLRQSEAEEMSKKSDLMIVVGGKNSSNTTKLYEICSKNTNTILVENEDDLPNDISYKFDSVGIISGAS
ncbi:MAG: 4-hydroxy-3-methylbut-2-enyl diphosphate reductase, partial [Clostridia bacterium]|nr:4-hydroxy-3-methylbut-2-enyl diphosphate reductase [Clostridia bacterium]